MRPAARSSLTYANVVATLALFVALGGGAYAAAALPAGSVGTRQLKRNAVVTDRIRMNAVNGSRVLNNSLTGADIDESTLRRVRSAVVAERAITAATAAAAATAVTAKTAAAAATATTAARADNATRAAAAGALDTVTYKVTKSTVPGIDKNTEPVPAGATCDAGQRVVGGGAQVDDPTAAYVVDEYPDKSNTTWTARIGNDEPAPHHFTVYAICIAVAG